jgi:hypothetical protein
MLHVHVEAVKAGFSFSSSDESGKAVRLLPFSIMIH